MIKHVYNFRDERADEYGTPIFTDDLPEQVAAKYEKSIHDLQIKVARLSEININDPKVGELLLQSSALKDTVIYHVADFDTKTGEYIPLPSLVLVARLSDYFAKGA